MAPLGYWSDFEAFIAIICACLPDSRFFIGHMKPQFLSSRRKTTSGGSPHVASASSWYSRKSGGKKAGVISVTTEYGVELTGHSANSGSFEQLTDQPVQWYPPNETHSTYHAGAWPMQQAYYGPSEQEQQQQQQHQFEYNSGRPQGAVYEQTHQGTAFRGPNSYV